MAGLYLVTFVGDYFNLTTVVESESDEAAKNYASYVILSEYGWDVQNAAKEIIVELEGGYA